MVVAHRLSTIRYPDQIIVMDKGQIVEIVNHEQRIKRGVLYYKLVDLCDCSLNN